MFKWQANSCKRSEGEKRRKRAGGISTQCETSQANQPFWPTGYRMRQMNTLLMQTVNLQQLSQQLGQQ